MLALFVEGWAVMRERLGVYVCLGALCALAGAFGASGLLEAARAPQPQSAAVFAALWAVPGLRAALLCTALALFFILPSALRRLRPEFRMTPGRVVATLLVLCSIGLAVDIGFLALVLPGVIVGVLISQALFNVLLADHADERTPFARVIGAFTRSMRMTSGRFISTLGVVTFSLLVLLVPFFIVFVGMLVLIPWNPRSLIVSAPALFLTFVYFECVRYVMIVRWYEKLVVLP